MSMYEQAVQSNRLLARGDSDLVELGLAVVN